MSTSIRVWTRKVKIWRKYDTLIQETKKEYFHAKKMENLEKNLNFFLHKVANDGEPTDPMYIESMLLFVPIHV